MRTVSYNIKDGGNGRAEALTKVIAARRPDVVCLVEADDGSVIERIANHLKMDFVHAPGDKHASALLSRWTISASINHAPFHPSLEKSLLEATVIDPQGQEWIIGVVHLHAKAFEQDEQKREEEITQVLKIFEPHRQAGRAHLLCGDFNSNAPTQQIDPQQCKPSTREAWQANGGLIPRRVVQRILDAGYVDSLHAVRGSEADRMASFTTEFPGQRLDYIFTFGIDPAHLEDAWVDQSPPARHASDHFPIGLQIGAILPEP